jgi:hypothetical protein
VLLCSDGLSNELSENEIVTLLSSNHLAQQKAEDLVRLAKAHGGRDNITTVVVEIKHVGSVGERSDMAKVAVLGDSVSEVSSDNGDVLREGLELDNTGVQSHGVTAGIADLESTQSLTDSDEATLLDFPAYNPGGSNSATIDQKIGSQISREDTDNVDKSPSNDITSRPVKTKQKGTLIFDLTDEHDDTEQIDSTVPFLTFRTIIFAALMMAVALSAYGAVKWFSDNSYYVGLSGNNIAIYHGRPHGQYFFSPKLVAQSNLTTSDVLPNQVSALQNGVEVNSLNSAYQLINALKAQEKKIGLGTGTTTTTIPFSQLLTQTT